MDPLPFCASCRIAQKNFATILQDLLSHLILIQIQTCRIRTPVGTTNDIQPVELSQGVAISVCESVSGKNRWRGASP